MLNSIVDSTVVTAEREAASRAAAMTTRLP